jgi:hypothetical protein
MECRLPSKGIITPNDYLVGDDAVLNPKFNNTVQINSHRFNSVI